VYHEIRVKVKRHRPRKYEMKARARSQEETRARIVDAAMMLHERLGLAQTTIAAIAEAAGVQRLTVYRHFPDELSLLRACGGQYRASHPPPDPTTWRGLAARARLAQGLTELYRHFRETAAMWSHVLRDAETSAVVREAAEPRFRYLQNVKTALGEGWPAARAHAAIGHAVQFSTWRSLAAEGLSDAEAVELMIGMVLAAS
jgi:AcrR family transcriptional regulator